MARIGTLRRGVAGLVIGSVLAAGGSGCSMFQRKAAPAAVPATAAPVVVAPAAPAQVAPAAPTPPVKPAPAPVVPVAAPAAPAAPTPVVPLTEPQLTRIRVPDMEDLCCATKVETILAGTPGVRSAKVDFPTRLATVSFFAARTSAVQLVAVLRAAGWQAELAAGR